MSKLFKKILGVAAIGTAVAGAVYYFKKNQETDEDFEDEFEDEDFDLDNDLKPVTDREYVSLTPKSNEAKDTKRTKQKRLTQNQPGKMRKTTPRPKQPGKKKRRKKRRLLKKNKMTKGRIPGS